MADELISQEELNQFFQERKSMIDKIEQQKLRIEELEGQSTSSTTTQPSTTAEATAPESEYSSLKRSVFDSPRKLARLQQLERDCGRSIGDRILSQAEQDLQVYFGPKSDASMAMQLLKRNPELYQRARSKAIRFGLVTGKSAKPDDGFPTLPLFGK